MIFMTITQITERIVSENPFLQDALKKRLINYRALADEIKPDVEKENGKSVKTPALVMALRRYSEKMHKPHLEKISFGRDSELDAKYKIVEFSLKKSRSVFRLMPKIFDIVRFEEGGVLNFTNGSKDVSIITNEIYKDKILPILKGEKILEINDDLVAISFRYSREFRKIPGSLHAILHPLAWENVNIVELIETMTETILLVKKEDSSKALQVLQHLMR